MITIVIRVSKIGGLVISPIFRPPSKLAKPEFLKPNWAMKKPTAIVNPNLRFLGIIFTMKLRRPVIDTMIKSVPEINKAAIMPPKVN
jgi:hypothetical protein